MWRPFTSMWGGAGIQGRIWLYKRIVCPQNDLLEKSAEIMKALTIFFYCDANRGEMVSYLILDPDNLVNSLIANMSCWFQLTWPVFEISFLTVNSFEMSSEFCCLNVTDWILKAMHGDFQVFVKRFYIILSDMSAFVVFFWQSVHQGPFLKVEILLWVKWNKIVWFHLLFLHRLCTWCVLTLVFRTC